MATHVKLKKNIIFDIQLLQIVSVVFYVVCTDVADIKTR